MPQQLGFMAKTWLPMALKLCELYSCGTPDGWAVHFMKEYRKREREQGEYKIENLPSADMGNPLEHKNNEPAIIPSHGIILEFPLGKRLSTG